MPDVRWLDVCRGQEVLSPTVAPVEGVDTPTRRHAAVYEGLVVKRWSVRELGDSKQLERHCLFLHGAVMLPAQRHVDVARPGTVVARVRKVVVHLADWRIE